MNILMEKKKSERIKRTIEDGKRRIDYSFEKLNFGEELGEQTTVSARNPFRHSDLAVKPSVLAGRLEKPFKLFICRHWHCDSRGIYQRRNSISVL
jgi:hypothetical protein